jgi:hypothetical protein
VWILLAASTATAQEVDDSAKPVEERVSLRARVELEFVDVEGAGGLSNLDPGLIRPRRRAPYADLDKATLDLGIKLRPWLLARLELRADADDARADRAYLDARAVQSDRLQLLFHAGRQRPMQRPANRRVETWSPIGAVFWRSREWHAGTHARLALGEITLDAIASVAMQRDLGDEAMGEDDGMPTIAFANSRPKQGAAAEGGGLRGVSGRGAHAAVFAFRGRLLDNTGPARLEELDGYDEIGNPASRLNYWIGGRAGFDQHGAHAFAEGVYHKVGLLKRRGFELGASYTFGLELGGEHMAFEPFVRYGQITTTNLPEVFLQPETWDREQWVFAALLRPIDELTVKLEYLWLEERTGDADIDDNQILVHFRIESEVL